MTRRKFIATAAGALAAAGIGGYSYWETGDLGPRLLDVPLEGLPAGFNGCRIALLGDLHHGWFISRDYLAGAVRLVCCGHTHGGQADLPFIGRPFIPSAYGQKYALGLVQAPHTKTFVTTGVGSIFPPLRFRCPPEVALLTLAKA